MPTVTEILVLIDTVIAAWLAGDPLNKWFNYRIGDYTINKTTTLEALIRLRQHYADIGETTPVEEVTVYDDPDL